MKIEEIIGNETIKNFFQIKDNNISKETREIIESLKECNYTSGQSVVTYGGSAEDGLYIILEGIAEAYSKDGKIIGIMKEGSFIGELALISGKTRMATVCYLAVKVQVKL